MTGNDFYDSSRCPLINKGSKVLIASRSWWEKCETINSEDIETFCKIRRNKLIHEMFPTSTNGLDDASLADFFKIYSLSNKIEKWWILEYEIPLNPEICNDETHEIDTDGVMPGSMVVLSAIIEIVTSGNNKKYEEVCRKLGIDVKG